MKYIKHMFAIFRTYQLCGFSPFALPFDPNQIWCAIHSSDKRHRRWLIYNYSLLVTLFLLVVCNFVYHEIHSDTRVSTMLNYLTFLMFSAMRMLAVFVVFESLLTRSRQMQMLYLLNDVDEILSKDLVITLSRSGLFWLIFWLIKLTSLQTMIFIMKYGRTRSVLSVSLSLWYTVPLFISSIRYYQVTHYIELIGHRFKLLSNYTNSISGREFEIKSKIQTVVRGQFQTEEDNFKRNNDLYDEVVRIRRVYHNLWQATICLNSSFRWSLLLSIGCSFVIILVNSYRSLLYILSKPDDRAKFGGNSIIIFFIWAVFHSIYFVKLSGSCYNVLRKV